MAPIADASTTTAIAIGPHEGSRFRRRPQLQSIDEGGQIAQALSVSRFRENREQLALERPVVPGGALLQAPRHHSRDVLHGQGDGRHGSIVDLKWKGTFG
jgi:hypothetical protein